jgi:hypothetical protein
MLLGGLWHGANWTFVAWGFFHGLILCLFRLIDFRDPKPGGSLGNRLYRAACIAVMFHLTCLGWLLFRADSFSSIQKMLIGLTGSYALTPLAKYMIAFAAFHVLPMLLIEWYVDGENDVDRLATKPWYFQAPVYLYLIAMIVIFQAEGAHEFIYFQF